MKNFLSALSFLTIIKFNVKTDYKPEFFLPYFSHIGFLIGLCLCFLAVSTQNYFFSPVLLLIFLTAITGGLHLDGFLDTADALFSHRTTEQKLQILKDPHVGSMGIIAVILLFLLEFSALHSLRELKILLFIPVYSRYGMLFGMHFLPYLRDNGLGKQFVNKIKFSVFLQITPYIFLMLLLFNFKFTLLFHLVFFLNILFIIKFYKFTLGGITGDLLGAMNELLTATLLTLSALLL
jgi:adenosylcobinamide-GDP ribazoletransferase